MDTTARKWLVRFAATFALLFAGCWIAPFLLRNVPQFPPRTAGEIQIGVLHRYFTLPPQDIVVVGSSLAWHLKDQFFPHGDVRNAAIPGSSSLTGLAVLEANPNRPRAIAVETNILDREVDERLVARFAGKRQRQPALAPLRTLAASYQGARDDTLTFGAERLRAILASPPGPDRSQAAVSTLSSDWNRPVRRDVLARNAQTLKRLAAELEAQGVRILFFDMPYPSRLNTSTYATTAREVFSEGFAGDARVLTLDYPADQMRSEADGVHLDDRSSVIFAAALDRAIHERLESR